MRLRPPDCMARSQVRRTGTPPTLAKFILSRRGSPLEKMKAGGEIDWRLRQATGIAKAPFVAEFVRMLVESGEKVLLYGWHHSVYQIWHTRLTPWTKVAYFTGEETANQKERARKEFIEGEAQVLIMSLRAGAGLDGLNHDRPGHRPFQHRASGNRRV